METTLTSGARRVDGNEIAAPATYDRSRELA